MNSPKSASMVSGVFLPYYNEIVTVNGANDTFTVLQAGIYEIEYVIHLTTPLFVLTRVMRNATQINESGFTPGSSTDIFAKKFTVTLAAGDTISLQLYLKLGKATLSTDLTKITSLKITKQ